MKTDYGIVITTTDSKAVADRITQSLLEKRLAACIQQFFVQSSYRWQGAIETADEIRLEIKTTSAHFEAVRSEILTLHNYDVPEILMLPVTAGHRDYLTWLSDETRS